MQYSKYSRPEALWSCTDGLPRKQEMLLANISSGLSLIRSCLIVAVGSVTTVLLLIAGVGPLVDLCQDRLIQTTGPLLGILLDYFTDGDWGGVAHSTQKLSLPHEHTETCSSEWVFSECSLVCRRLFLPSAPQGRTQTAVIAPAHVRRLQMTSLCCYIREKHVGDTGNTVYVMHDINLCAEQSVLPDLHLYLRLGLWGGQRTGREVWMEPVAHSVYILGLCPEKPTV